MTNGNVPVTVEGSFGQYPYGRLVIGAKGYYGPNNAQANSYWFIVVLPSVAPPPRRSLENTKAVRMKTPLRPVEPDDEPFLRRLYTSARSTELAGLPWTEERKEAFPAMQFDAQSRHCRERSSMSFSRTDDPPEGFTSPGGRPGSG